MTTPAASVIVRAKNKEGELDRALAALRAQTVPVEIIVVDSGSTDGTTEVARRLADRLIEITPEEFTYGYALNVGAAAAGAPTHFALSSHCAPGRADWIERSLRHYELPEVAGTGGYRPPGPRGQTGAVLQDLAELRAHPYWGYSNTAGSWRAEVWRRFPFDETLDWGEDREWSLRVLQAGFAIAMDPELEVPSGHRMADGLRGYYHRNQRDSRAIAGFVPLPPYTAARAIADWWHVAPERGRSRTRLRSSPWRAAAILGRYAGERSARS